MPCHFGNAPGKAGSALVVQTPPSVVASLLQTWNMTQEEADDGSRCYKNEKSSASDKKRLSEVKFCRF